MSLIPLLQAQPKGVALILVSVLSAHWMVASSQPQKGSAPPSRASVKFKVRIPCIEFALVWTQTYHSLTCQAAQHPCSAEPSELKKKTHWQTSPFPSLQPMQHANDYISSQLPLHMGCACQGATSPFCCRPFCRIQRLTMRLLHAWFRCGHSPNPDYVSREGPEANSRHLTEGLRRQLVQMHWLSPHSGRLQGQQAVILPYTYTTCMLVDCTPQ